MEETWIIRGKEYHLKQLLGHGKGGYSYLAECENQPVVVKQIHHEPCDYYSFGNKIEAETYAYERLVNTGIRMPLMLAVDTEAERIVKEYIPGETVFEYVKRGENAERYIEQVREMATLAKQAGFNFDYYSTNFVIHDELIWYVDYECNEYSEEWNFENWGIKYWSRTPEFIEAAKQNETK